MLRQMTSALVAVACATTLALAQPGTGRGPMGPGGMGERHEALAKKLNLTEAQELQMKKLRIEMMKKQTEFRSKVQSLRLDIKQLFLADKVDRNAIEKNIKAISAAQEQMKLNMLDHWFAVNALLTPEQQKTWKAHAQMLGEGMQGKRGEHMRRMMREHSFGNAPDFE